MERCGRNSKQSSRQSPLQACICFNAQLFGPKPNTREKCREMVDPNASLTVLCKTTVGDVYIDIFDTWSPRGVRRFLKLLSLNFFDFHKRSMLFMKIDDLHEEGMIFMIKNSIIHVSTPYSNPSHWPPRGGQLRNLFSHIITSTMVKYIKQFLILFIEL